MRSILILLFVNLLTVSALCAENVACKDTTDIAGIISPEEPDFVNVLSQELLTAYLQSETDISCPGVVLVVYDENGNKLGASSYPLTQFIEAIQKNDLFKSGRIYLILTRFKTYYFNNTKAKTHDQ